MLLGTSIELHFCLRLQFVSQSDDHLFARCVYFKPTVQSILTTVKHAPRRVR